MINEFYSLAPAKSLLGRELQALQREQQRQQLLFESSTEKMAYDTSAYRRSTMAIERFVAEWLPRLQAAKLKIDDDGLARFREREKALMTREVVPDRRVEARCWTVFALEHYRKVRPAVRLVRRYHPDVVSEALRAWQTFRTELRFWTYGRQPFDGSQAMSSMFQFFLRLDLLAAVND